MTTEESVIDEIPDHVDELFTSVASIETLNVGASVNVRIKVVRVDDVQIVHNRNGDELKLQKVTVADSSGRMSISLWQHRNQLKHGQCYQMFNLQVPVSVTNFRLNN